MELLRLSRAARPLGVHPVMLRLWADSGKIPVTWIGRECSFSSDDADAMEVPCGESTDRPAVGMPVCAGLGHSRAGIVAGRAGGRIARCCYANSGLLAIHGATVEVLRPKAQGGREELLEDFTSLVTTFAGRLYGMRSAAARKRLLAESDRCPPGGVW